MTSPFADALKEGAFSPQDPAQPPLDAMSPTTRVNTRMLPVAQRRPSASHCPPYFQHQNEWFPCYCCMKNTVVITLPPVLLVFTERLLHVSCWHPASVFCGRNILGVSWFSPSRELCQHPNMWFPCSWFRRPRIAHLPVSVISSPVGIFLLQLIGSTVNMLSNVEVMCRGKGRIL